jgi:glucans biosynthesis protein
MIDFEGPALKKLPVDAKVEAAVTAENGKVVETVAFPNEITGGWRVAVRLNRIDDKKPVEIRGLLRANNEVISETWSYILEPE